MSISNIPLIMDRIESAKEDSKIAVFQCKKPGLLDSRFHNTVLTTNEINSGDKNYIGSYDQYCNKSEVYEYLKKFKDSYYED